LKKIKPNVGLNISQFCAACAHELRAFGRCPEGKNFVRAPPLRRHSQQATRSWELLVLIPRQAETPFGARRLNGLGQQAESVTWRRRSGN
jgi:hypothetical protein